MPSPDEIDQLREDTADLQAVMIAALVEHWMANVQRDPAGLVAEFQDFILDAVAEYGQAAGAIAVDFYESVRPSGPPFRPVPVLNDDVLGRGTLNWATKPLQTEEWEKALDRTAASIQKATKQAVVDTIGEATEEDPLDVKFARWPRNPDPCAWCVLRASRGAVYWTEATAERGDHLKCGCEVTPVFTGEPLPYLLKPYKAQYLAGASEAEADIAAAGPGKARRKALLSGMRRANGTH